MLDLRSPLARCCACGWEGVPTYMGTVSTRCPKCEGAEDAGWLELFALIALDPLYRRLQQFGNLPLFTIRRRRRDRLAAFGAPAKVSRNAPCPCGSGKKWKLCCGR